MKIPRPEKTVRVAIICCYRDGPLGFRYHLLVGKSVRASLKEGLCQPQALMETRDSVL